MVSQTDLKFYYTGAEPLAAQSNPSQSLGGYPSSSEYSLFGSLLSNIIDTSTNIPINTTLSGTSLLIDQEIIQTEGNGSDPTVLNRGALSTTVSPHIAGAAVYSIPSQPLFNNALSSNLSQYRCLAITNTNVVDTFYNLSFYFKQSSLTPYTNIQMAIEDPKTEYYSGIAYGGSTISIVDNGLSSFADNWFAGCVIIITSGLNIGDQRTVISFDNATSTLVLDSSLPFTAMPGDQYSIQNAPSQTINTGIVSPLFGTSNVSNLSVANSTAMAIGINVTGNRLNSSNLAPNETVYLWLSRTRTANAPAQLNNRVIFTAAYLTSQPMGHRLFQNRRRLRG